MNQARGYTPPMAPRGLAVPLAPSIGRAAVAAPQSRSYSVGVEAQNANGDEITIEVNVETAADLPNAVAIAEAAVGALPAGYSADAPDEDE